MNTYLCSCCCKTVKNNHKALLCTGCNQWIHISCGLISKKQYDDKNETFANWQCQQCLFKYLPFYGVDLSHGVELYGINSQVTPNQIIDIIPSEFPDGKGIKVAQVKLTKLKIADLQEFLSNNPYDIIGYI